MTQLITADGAAERLGVKASWVLREARAGRIPHIRMGRYVRFDPDELAAWCEGGAAARSGPAHEGDGVKQLAVAVKALEEIEAYFVGGWPDPDDLPRIRKLGRSGLGKAPWPERGAA
jgi:excisionase family DNA binding protein